MSKESKETRPPENAPFFVDNEVIVINRNGVWIADGTEITHEGTRKLFAKSLKKDADGYFLSIGRETKRIQVEDTAYFVQRIDGEPSAAAGPAHGTPSTRGSVSPMTVSLSDETQEVLDPSTLSYRPGRLTCRIKQGTEEAKFLHAPYFDLLRHLEEDGKGYFLRFGPDKTGKIELARK